MLQLHLSDQQFNWLIMCLILETWRYSRTRSITWLLVWILKLCLCLANALICWRVSSSCVIVFAFCFISAYFLHVPEQPWDIPAHGAAGKYGHETVGVLVIQLTACRLLHSPRLVAVLPNYMNPGYFPLAATPLKPQQIPMFLHISTRVWGRRWYPQTSEQ